MELSMDRGEMAEMLDKIRIALNGYPDSDLVSLATSVMAQAERLNELPANQLDYIRGLMRASDIANQFGFDIVGEADDEDPVKAKIYSRQAQMIAACEVSRLIYAEVIKILLGKSAEPSAEARLFQSL